MNTWKKSTLLFDIDQGEWSAGLWVDFGFQPTWVAVNEETGDCHFGYILVKPVICNHERPVQYFSAVQYAMNHLLNGDSAYPGVLTKNPFHSDHKLIWYGNLYDLGTLAKASIPFAPPRPKRIRMDRIDLTKVNNGERGVSMFHEVRGVAYVEVRKFRGVNRIYTHFYESLLEHAVNMNYSLIEPLTLPEVKHISTSVAKWTFKEDPKKEEEFRKRQSYKGRKNSKEHLSRAGKISGMNRYRGSLAEQQPWVELGISERTFYRWKKNGRI